MHKYQVIIYWSNEDDTFIAEVPELPGCVSHGDTHAIALANANEAIQLRIDTAKEFGEPIPLPKRRRMVSTKFGSSKSKMPGSFGHPTTVRRNNPKVINNVRPFHSTTNPKAH